MLSQQACGRQLQARLKPAVCNAGTQLSVQRPQQIACTFRRERERKSEKWFHNICRLWTFCRTIALANLCDKYRQRRHLEIRHWQGTGGDWSDLAVSIVAPRPVEDL